MSPGLRVLAPGPFTTVQDLGRVGYQYAGVPVSGALDPVALRLANLVVGNAEDEAGLEFIFAGPELRVEAPSVRLAAAGAGLQIIGQDKTAIPPLQSVRLTRGQRVRVGSPAGIMSGMLAVEGGFDVPLVMGSRATYVRGGFGGFEGRTLREGDCLPLRLDDASIRDEWHSPAVSLDQPRWLRLLPGPQMDYFDDATIQRLTEATFTVSPASDRMGVRLGGPTLAPQRSADIVSDGIAPGAIQVPGSGQPIVLRTDRQTTGGYPKIAVVISADLPALGRLGPGAEIDFELVTPTAAAEARRAAQQDFSDLAAHIAPVGDEGLRQSELLSANLVGGVIDAEDW